MRSENAIEVKEVSKKFKVYMDKGHTLKEKTLFQKRREYEERTVLDEISFAVKKGEAVGLIGHNGCGKSTTLKLLTKIIYPDSGQIEMCGRVSSLIELGAGFHPDMSGRENIYINASIFGLTKREIEARFQDIVDFSQLEQFIDHPVRTYSSGMYMRLAFSVAIHVDADILLIDEILGVGDAGFQAKCFDYLKKIKANGTTIVIVSHALEQIEQICDRSIWIQEGRIREEGVPQEVHRHYLDDLGLSITDENKEEHMQKQIEQNTIHAELNEQNTQSKNQQVDTGAMARQLMFTKWKMVDASVKESPFDRLTCRVCGYCGQRNAYETKESDCIFYGGHLVRYVCPVCGVIFGPTKFMDMRQQEIDDDYRVHYLGFSEGDSAKKEEKAFFMLHPSKKGVYLNYGCGRWTNSMQNLRSQGYQIFGFEPYAPDEAHPYLITDREKLSKMRFDGIYSNDVLEHFLDPVQELDFMRGLLLHEECKMAHSTACYEYRYAHTRFHIHFFTGRSVSVLCEKSGLKMIASCNELETDDFMCCVFAPVKPLQPLSEMMHIQGDGEKEKDVVTLRGESLLYGPYLNLAGRHYRLDIPIKGSKEAELKITADCGETELGSYMLREGENQIHFSLTSLKENIEFVIENKEDQVTIGPIRLF